MGLPRDLSFPHPGSGQVCPVQKLDPFATGSTQSLPDLIPEAHTGTEGLRGSNPNLVIPILVSLELLLSYGEAVVASVDAEVA